MPRESLRRVGLLALVTALSTALGALPAAAGPAGRSVPQTRTVVLTTADRPYDPGVANQGWWAQDHPGSDASDNYVIGWLRFDGRFRNFFTFDLSGVDGTITAASLRLERNLDHPVTDGLPARVSLWDVTTDPVTLNDNDGVDRAIYRDLGTGTRYGGHVVGTGAGGTVGFPLNANAVTALDAARGGSWSIGGSLLTRSEDWYLFSRTDGRPAVLQLTVQD